MVVQKPKGTGRWYVVLELDRDPGTGKRRRKWHSGFASKRDAERGLARLLADRDDGAYVAPQKLTFGDFLTEHWLPAIEQTVRPTTYNGYRSHVDLYLLPRLGAVRLQQLAPTQFSELYRELQKAGGVGGAPLTSSTVRRVHNTAHRSLRDAVQWGHLRANPAAGAVKPRQPTVGSRDIATWTAPELKAFLEHLGDDRLYALWRLAATTGMRRGEVLGLRWTDVDLVAGRVAIRQTITAISSRLMFGEPKTKRGRRNVALDADTTTALTSWRDQQQRERLEWGDAWQDSGSVFTHADGRLIHPDLMSKWFVRHVKESGLRPIRLHDLRHTHASLALQAGIPAKVVSERLGHATVAFTLDVYSHVIPGLQEDAAERIAALVQ